MLTVRGENFTHSSSCKVQYLKNFVLGDRQAAIATRSNRFGFGTCSTWLAFRLWGASVAVSIMDYWYTDDLTCSMNLLSLPKTVHRSTNDTQIYDRPYPSSLPRHLKTPLSPPISDHPASPSVSFAVLLSIPKLSPPKSHTIPNAPSKYPDTSVPLLL